MRTLTSRCLIKVLRRILSRNHPNLEHQILTAGTNPSDVPPLKESPNLNPVKLRDPTLLNFTSDFLRVSGEVVIGRESDLAGTTKVDGEIAGGIVDGVSPDVPRQKPDGEAEVGELDVGGGDNMFGVLVFRRSGLGGERKGEEEEREEEKRLSHGVKDLGSELRS